MGQENSKPIFFFYGWPYINWKILWWNIFNKQKKKNPPFVNVETEEAIFILQGMHCLLNGSPSSIERLHRQRIYPIVVFARHKSGKQLR